MGISIMTGVRLWGRALIAVALSAVLLSVSASAMAQEVSPEQLALARKYVDLTDNASVYEITMVEIGIGTMRELVQQNPDLVDPVNEIIEKTLEEYRDRKGDLLDQFARVYALRFTIEELQQIVAFYESPTGQKLAKANMGVNDDLQVVIQVFTNNTRPEFFAKVRADLRAMGYQV